VLAVSQFLTATADRSPVGRWAVARELALALSWANLLFVRVWVELLTFTPSNTFYMRQLPQTVHYLAAVAGVLLLGGILGALSLWARSRRSGRVTLAMTWFRVVLAILIANQLRLAVSTMIPALYPWLRQPLLGRIGWTGLALAGIFGCVLLGRIVLRYRGRWISGVTLAVFLAWPLVPLNLGQALWRSKHTPQLQAPGTPPVGTDRREDAWKGGVSRVVWVVFDEWDYRLTFEDRPSDLAMPELEALAGESLVARRAYSTSSETGLSVPSLVTGREIRSLAPLGEDDAEVTLEADLTARRLRSMDSVFAEMRRRGIPSAVAGWYLPYCRIWRESLDYCEWQETDSERVMRAETVGQSVQDAFRSFIETGVLSPLGVSLAAERARRTSQRLWAASESALRDRRYRFVFLHLPIPHAPFYYDRCTGGTRKGNNYVSGYFDHLALLDRTLAGVIGVLRESGSWADTALLVSSDHAFRSSRALDGKSDSRIPFLLRIPRSQGSTVAEFPFQTLVSRQLVAGLMSGRIGTQAEAVSFLKRHSGQRGCGHEHPGEATQ
jgi:hypothetical protein